MIAFTRPICVSYLHLVRCETLFDFPYVYVQGPPQVSILTRRMRKMI